MNKVDFKTPNIEIDFRHDVNIIQYTMNNEKIIRIFFDYAIDNEARYWFIHNLALSASILKSSLPNDIRQQIDDKIKGEWSRWSKWHDE